MIPYSPDQDDAQEGTVKLVFFDDFKLGLLKGDAVVDVSETVRDIPHTGPHNLISGLVHSSAPVTLGHFPTGGQHARLLSDAPRHR